MPLSVASPPLIIFTRVDFPAPLWPTSPTHSPVATEKLTLLMALTAPKLLLAPSTVMTSAPGAGLAMTLRQGFALHAADDRLSVFQRVFDIGNAADFGRGKVRFKIVLINAQEWHHQVLRHGRAIEDLLGHPERQG